MGGGAGGGGRERIFRTVKYSPENPPPDCAGGVGSRRGAGRDLPNSARLIVQVTMEVNPCLNAASKASRRPEN